MSGAEVICGIGALRRNKLQRQLNTAPAAQPSPKQSYADPARNSRMYVCVNPNMSSFPDR